MIAKSAKVRPEPPGEREVVLRGLLLGKEQAELFRRHRRSQGRSRQPQETVSKKTPGGRATTLRGKAEVECCGSTRKAASHREREAGPKKRVDVKQAELTGSITCRYSKRCSNKVVC